MATHETIHKNFDEAVYGGTDGHWHGDGRRESDPNLILWLSIIRQALLEESRAYLSSSDFRFLLDVVGIDPAYMAKMIERELPAIRARLRVRTRHDTKRTILASA